MEKEKIQEEAIKELVGILVKEKNLNNIVFEIRKI